MGQARRYKSQSEPARALKLIARADLEILSSPVDKSLMLERLVLSLASAGSADESSSAEG